MATYDWPTAFKPDSIEWGFAKAGEQFKGPYNGTIQAIELVAERFVLSVRLPSCLFKTAAAGAREAFFGRLTGGFNLVRAWHFAREVPLGTMRGTPTLSSSAARGNSSVVIQTTAAATLLAGDMFSVGGQLFMTADDATANGSGVMTVNVVHRVRAAISSSASVTWNKPTATFVLPATVSRFAYEAMVIGSTPFDFEESW